MSAMYYGERKIRRQNSVCVCSVDKSWDIALCVYVLGSLEAFSLKCYQVIAGLLFGSTFQYYYGYYLEFQYILGGTSYFIFGDEFIGRRFMHYTLNMNFAFGTNLSTSVEFLIEYVRIKLYLSSRSKHLSSTIVDLGAVHRPHHKRAVFAGHCAHNLLPQLTRVCNFAGCRGAREEMRCGLQFAL